MRLPRLLAAGVFAAGLLTGCSGNPLPKVQAPHVQVDTPALRAAKAKAGVADCPTTHGPAATDGLPDATLPCFGGGRSVKLSELKGPLVINLWAQWCGPCRREMPIYQRFSEKYDGRVAVLGIDWQDTQPEMAMRLVEQTGVTFPLLADAEPVLHGNVLPRVVMVDRDGRIAWQGAEEMKSLGQLEDLVATHLGVGR